MLVCDFIDQSAFRFPDKEALVCDQRRWTYQDIQNQVNNLASGLASLGIERGDRVAVFLDNSVEAVVSIFGIMKAGGVFMMVNPTTKSEKLAYILNDSGAKTIICHSRRLPVLENSLNQVKSLEGLILCGCDVLPSSIKMNKQLSWNQLRENQHHDSFPSHRCIDMDLAALIYTSGSTGFPKGVMVTHHNMVSAATSITTYLENSPDDIILNVLPLSFDYGLYQVLMAFKFGGTVVLEKSFTYPHSILELIATEHITGFPILPTLSAILLQMDLTKYDFQTLRYITNTGAALPVSHITKLRSLLPHVRIYSMYGLTECKRVSYLPPDQIDKRPKSVGRGMPNEEIYIVDSQGRRLGPNLVGELVIRGSNVMKGYWNKPEETSAMLKPGLYPWENVLYSGDLFTMDDEGFFYFVGRKDDIIKSRGEKVSPREVENVLYQIDDVAEAAVIGIPDEILGQAIKAVITLKKGSAITEQDILKFCSDRLENYMVPKCVEFCDEMPRTGTGKIDKKSLK
jgi:acyl-CoA ligase (AMP-forming) (exosortase A-associated)